MSSQALQTIARAAIALTGINVAVAGATYYNTDVKLERNHEEAEARMDELEGTLRGHIGLIEDSLQRIESTIKGEATEGGWGQGMSKKGEEMYTKRGKDDKKK